MASVRMLEQYLGDEAFARYSALPRRYAYGNETTTCGHRTHQTAGARSWISGLSGRLPLIAVEKEGRIRLTNRFSAIFRTARTRSVRHAPIFCAPAPSGRAKFFADRARAEWIGAESTGCGQRRRHGFYRYVTAANAEALKNANRFRRRAIHLLNDTWHRLSRVDSRWTISG
jgi:hypothetical protein